MNYDLPQDQIEAIKQILKSEVMADLGRKGGQVKSERKRRAGQANIAKASARLAEIRAAKRVLAGKQKGQPSNASKISETS